MVPRKSWSSREPKQVGHPEPSAEVDRVEVDQEARVVDVNRVVRVIRNQDFTRRRLQQDLIPEDLPDQITLEEPASIKDLSLALGVKQTALLKN